MKKVLVLCFFASILMACLPVVWAEEATKEQSIFTLGEIEVTGETERYRTPVDRVDAEEMENFNRKTLPEALSLVPGVTVTNVGSRNEKVVYVRGFDQRRVPVFQDGVPIYVPYDRNFDYGRFFTTDLSQIVVSKGFTSVLYGPNTMGGAINLVTLKPQKPFEGSVGVGAGSGGMYYGYANVGTNQKKWYLQAGGSYFNQDSFPLPHSFTDTAIESGRNRKNAYSEDMRANFKIGFTPLEGHEYAFGYINQQGEKGQPPDVNGTSSSSYWQWPRWNKESYYLTTNTPLGDKTYVKTRLFYDKFDNILDFFTDDTYTTLKDSFGQRSFYDDYTIGGSLEAGTTLIPRNNLKFAFHYKRDSHSGRNRIQQVTVSGTTYTVKPPWDRSDTVTTSFGLEDTIDITKKFYTIAGVSYDTLYGLRSNKWVYNSSTTPTFHDFETNTEHSWNPQLGLFYKLSDTGKLRATIEKKTRFPSLKEKYSWGLPSRKGTSIENPELKPEEAINYEIGYEDLFFGKIRFGASLFRNDITDAIWSVSWTEGSTKYNQYQNIGKVRQYGAEVQATVAITNNFEYGMSYTYLDWRNEAGDATIKGYKLTDVPNHKFFTYVQYATPLKGLSLLASMECNSRRYGSTDGTTEGDAFELVNAKAAYTIKQGVTVEAGINNLFDRKYELSDGYPEPGRTLFANLRYKF